MAGHERGQHHRAEPLHAARRQVHDEGDKFNLRGHFGVVQPYYFHKSTEKIRNSADEKHCVYLMHWYENSMKILYFSSQTPYFTT